MPEGPTRPSFTQADAYREVWATFERLDRLAHHRADWGAWAAGRAVHYLLLVPLQDQPIVERVQVVQRRLAGLPGLEVHPPAFLHLSVQSLGFLAAGDEPARDEIPACALADLLPRLAEAVRRVAPFSVPVGGASAFHSSVFLELGDVSGLLALRAAAREAAGGVVQRIDPYPEMLFHLTLGYFDHTADAVLARAALRPLRGLDVGRVEVSFLDLVAIPTHQRQAYPALAPPLARFPLGPG